MNEVCGYTSIIFEYADPCQLPKGHKGPCVVEEKGLGSNSVQTTKVGSENENRD